jgi:hypothetical protein
MPRFRFTVRRMMVAVAVVAVLLAMAVTLSHRRSRFESLRDYHASRAPYVWLGPMGTLWERQGEWHWAMKRKYERAARYPWLPVAPDPPEPK